MIVHGLKSCDTVRAALRALRAAGKTPEFRDFRDDPPSRADVARFHAAIGESLLNRTSATWRALPEAERSADPVDLMTLHPALIRRPVIEAGGRVTCGWKADQQALWLG
jgi:arsenate reductase-like glutaredoxin family protein